MSLRVRRVILKRYVEAYHIKSQAACRGTSGNLGSAGRCHLGAHRAPNYSPPSVSHYSSRRNRHSDFRGKPASPW